MGDLETRLAAVLAVDVAGYSRLMEADGEGTHRRLRALMSGIVEPRIAEAGGRVVKRTGDGALVEFPTVGGAVEAAAAIQHETGLMSADSPPERALRLRIGISLGDVIVEADDIYGDGVNVAARLEALGDAGDIIVSEAALTALDRARFTFADLGVRRLKNMQRPVRIYRVALAAPDAPPSPPGEEAGFAGGERPSLAVLPFAAPGGSAAVRDLADVLAEDVTAALARWRTLPVIGHGSVAAWRDRAADARAVGQQLGARYVVQGSLRRLGRRLRVTLTLTDTEQTDSLLAEQIELDADDDALPVVQEALAVRLLAAIEPEVMRREQDRAIAVPVEEASAYELYVRGFWHHLRFTAEDAVRARGCFGAALELDPGHSQAAAAMAISLLHSANNGWLPDRKQAFETALRWGRHAVHLDPRDPLARSALGRCHLALGSLAEAEAELTESLRLNPANAATHANLAGVYNYQNRFVDALPHSQRAVDLAEHDPRRFMFLPILAGTHYLAGRYRDSLAVAQRALNERPEYPSAMRYMLAALGQLHHAREARPLAVLLRRIDGGLAGTEAILRQLFNEQALSHLREGLLRAGYV